MSHYFINDDSLSNIRKEITFKFLEKEYTFKTIPGVFSNSYLDKGSELLIKQVIDDGLSGKVLDLGTGYGPIGILLKIYNPTIDVLMSDINKRACLVAKENCQTYNLDNKVIESDGFNEINEKFDAIIFNPPIRAGKDIMYHLFEECAKHLNNNGSLWIVIRKDQGAKSTEIKLKTLFKTVVLKQRSKGYWIFKCNI